MRARTLAAAATAIALAVLPAAVAAQASSPSPIDAVSDAAAGAALRELIAGAPARGIPVEPLLTKVREGLAKRSDPERIRDAVVLLSKRLASARSALEPTYSVDELSAGAGALGSGVTASTLRDMRKAWQGKPLTVPLGVLTEMTADGVPSKLAASRLRDLMARNATGAQLVALGASVRADIAAGMAPGTSLEVRSKGVLSLLAAPFTNTFVPPPRRPG